MISVVIPTLNAERTLPRCFDSLIAAAVTAHVVRVVWLVERCDDIERLVQQRDQGARVARGRLAGRGVDKS